MPLDKDTVSRLNNVYPDLAVRWRRVAQSFFDHYRMQLKVTQGFRSYEDQMKYYKQGRSQISGTKEWQITNPSQVVSHAPPGYSYHNFGLGLDSAFVGSDPYLSGHPKGMSEFYWNQYGLIAESFGLVWGGRWPGMKQDRPHVQLGYGLSIHEIQMLMDHDGVKAVWSKIDQIITK